MAQPHPYLNRVVAGYQLMQYVGAGGMGEVFKAIHPETGQLVAVKVLYRLELAARFRNEAAIQASISHPNIAALFESSLLDNRPALVMEWVDGESLDELIRRRERLPNGEVARLIEQMVNALTYLHQHGIIHRDLKPSNVRIKPGGQIKIIDFGISKGLRTPQLTQAGFVVGTTEFMAPEQFRNHVEPKSDVWALGVLLYEMTTGHLPFVSPNPLALRRLIERGQYTNPQLLNPSIAPELASVMQDCLQVNPVKRPAAAEIGDRIRAENLTVQKVEANQLPWLTALIRHKRFTTTRYWVMAGLIGLGGIGLINRTPAELINHKKPVVKSIGKYEQIQVEVLNADEDLELVMPNGTVLAQEPFMVKRIPGQALSIIIRHRGVEQQFVIDPEVRDIYQCYFDR